MNQINEINEINEINQINHNYQILFASSSVLSNYKDHVNPY